MNPYKYIAVLLAGLRNVSVVFIMMPGLVLAQEQVDTVKKALPHTSADQMIKMVLGLLFVLVLIFLLAWLFKKYLGAGFISNAALKTIAGVSVGQKERVVLVQVGERQIVVGVASGQVNLLHLVEKGEEVKLSGEPNKGLFAEKLKQSLSGLEKK